MIECPKCSGNLIFDIKTQKMSCGHCGLFFDPYSIKDDSDDTIKNDTYNTNVFYCPECGGEIVSTELDATGFCSYCGAANILYSRIESSKKPKKIIPFKVTKEQCIAQYQSVMKNAFFAPKEMKSKKYIESLKGIYMPYWSFTVKQQCDLKIPVQRVYSNEDGIVTRHMELCGALNGKYDGIIYTASSSFLESVDEKLAPFEMTKSQKFATGYLSGFYADTPDIEYEIYKEDAINIANSETFKLIRNTEDFSKYTFFDDDIVFKLTEELNTEILDCESVMLPVWFMTYRKGDRVAYTIINGQNGESSIDIPIDTKKYILTSLGVSLPIMFLIYMFMQLSVSNLVLLISLILAVVSWMYKGELVNFNVNVPKDNVKYKSKFNTTFEKYRWKIKNNVLKKWSVIRYHEEALVYAGFILLAFAFTAILSGISMLTQALEINGIIQVVVLVPNILIAISGIKQCIAIKRRKYCIGFAGELLAAMFCVVVSFIEPVSKVYYYMAIVVEIVVMIYMNLSLINLYNLRSTKKVPQFNKVGGDDDAQ